VTHQHERNLYFLKHSFRNKQGPEAHYPSTFVVLPAVV
jgi:hypothetical protein